MSLAANNLWNVTIPGRQVDPERLAAALSTLCNQSDLDFRTKLLARDSLLALKSHWSGDRFSAWLRKADDRGWLSGIIESDLGSPGFPSLEKRVMEPTRPEIVQQILRELGLRLRTHARIEIGGAIALILSGNISRATEDIDIVNELPPELRSQQSLLDELAARYSLRLTHFQSHYLPTGWDTRVRSIGRFGQLDVFVIDVVDIFVGKLFSARVKDLDDLRALLPQFNKQMILERLRSSAAALMAQPQLAENARRNWYILCGESLPPEPGG
jgi:hypothetical protein